MVGMFLWAEQLENINLTGADLTSTLYTTDSGGKQVVVTRNLTNMFQGTTHLKQVSVSNKWVF